MTRHLVAVANRHLSLKQQASGGFLIGGGWFGSFDPTTGRTRTLRRNIDSEVLTRALKGVDEEIRNRFLGCMSARAADGIRDEMEARGPMKLAEVMEAQKAMIAIARGLAKDGSIQMGGGGDDDYV